ncbi:hypothetical protein B0T17DRAFT_614643 [Bombardia bombarda]|uniref:Uncharacterized protein n=1 Tax=Bombardia bombarda TaxID=252184 RepID=A0AA39X7J3_9PEZI|nr:hypothetical protein B0T17DRAFT_614643 [Bombardia bombarda]
MMSIPAQADLHRGRRALTRRTRLPRHRRYRLHGIPESLPPNTKTAQGPEVFVGAHCVAHLLLTHLLLPHLRAAAQSSSTSGAVRIVWCSSWLAENSSPKFGIEMDKLASGTGNNMREYAVSKAGDGILSIECGRLYGEYGILSVGLNPGNLNTNAFKGVDGLLRVVLNWVSLYNPRLGALTELYAGLSGELTMEGHQGAYIMPWGRVQESTPRQDIVDGARPVEVLGVV